MKMGRQVASCWHIEIFMDGLKDAFELLIPEGSDNADFVCRNFPYVAHRRVV